MKIVADAKYGEILGVHIIGPQATELIAEAVAVMELEGTVDELMFTIHAHPTISRGDAGRVCGSRRHGDQRINREPYIQAKAGAVWTGMAFEILLSLKEYEFFGKIL